MSWCPTKAIALHGSYTTYEWQDCVAGTTAIVDALNNLALNQCGAGAPCPPCRGALTSYPGGVGAQIIDDDLCMAGLMYSPFGPGIQTGVMLSSAIALSFFKPNQPYPSYAIVNFCTDMNVMPSISFVTAFEAQYNQIGTLQLYPGAVQLPVSANYRLSVAVSMGPYAGQTFQVLAVNWHI